MHGIEQRALASNLTIETLMQEAGKQCAAVVSSYVLKHALTKNAIVLAGRGNNGGDGYVTARYLLQMGFTVVVCQVFEADPDSPVRKERRRYEDAGGQSIDIDDIIPLFPTSGVIIDALFGTGFHGEVGKKGKELIAQANQSGLPIIAIDIPSGVNATTGQSGECVIQATITVALECAKTGYFLQNGYNYVGNVITCPIGLEPFIDPSEKLLQSIQQEDVAGFLPPIIRNRHKYQAGDVAAIAGSHGMAGAALLSSWAALKAGAGIVHLLHHDSYSAEFTGEPLEVVRVPYQNEKNTLATIKKAAACLIGPGLGKNSSLLNTVWPTCKKKKIVLDADALNWMAEKWPASKTFGPLPHAILTPHIGECNRLLACDTNEGVTAEFLNKIQTFVDQNDTHLILKGAPTFIFSAKSPVRLVLRGDPGMATAGSGDVLTGILAALLAQGVAPYEAMCLGVFLHCMAGEYAAKEECSYSMTATSILNHLADAFNELLRQLQ